MKMKPTDEERAVLDLMNEGIAPSRIDALLKRREGYAHDAIVGYWERDKRERRR